MRRRIADALPPTRGAQAALMRIDSGRDALLGVIGEFGGQLGGLLEQGFLTHGLGPFQVESEQR